MITLKHLEIFQKYHGDGDGFVRSGRAKENEIMNYSDWKLIEELIQDIDFLKKGLASNSYVVNTFSKLNENCDNIETIEELKRISEKYNKK